MLGDPCAAGRVDAAIYETFRHVRGKCCSLRVVCRDLLVLSRRRHGPSRAGRSRYLVRVWNGVLSRRFRRQRGRHVRGIAARREGRRRGRRDQGTNRRTSRLPAYCRTGRRTIPLEQAGRSRSTSGATTRHRRWRCSPTGGSSSLEPRGRDGEGHRGRAAPTRGTLDTTFGNGGKKVLDFGGQEEARAIALRADGRIVLAGTTGRAWQRPVRGQAAGRSAFHRRRIRRRGAPARTGRTSRCAVTRARRRLRSRWGYDVDARPAQGLPSLHGPSSCLRASQRRASFSPRSISDCANSREKKR